MPTEDSDKSRVAVLINHPIQYFSPGLRMLAEQGRVDLTVYYWNAAVDGVTDKAFGRHVRWHADLHSGYRWWSPPVGPSSAARLVALLRRLRRDRPESMLSFGWHSPVSRAAMLHSATSRTPLLFYGDTHPDYSVTGRYDRLRSLFLRVLFRVSAGALATGHANRTFYRNHGMPPDKIYDGVLPADIDIFARARAQVDLVPARTPAADQRVVLGFVGKFIECKAVDDLLEAVSRLPATLDWELWLIGDGPLRGKLTRLTDELGLRERVSFLGFRNLDELPDLMAKLDVLVLPSRRDNRPLVVLEAMSAGVATIVSSATGLWGAGDVVRDGDTGLVFRAGDVADLCVAIQRLIGDAELRQRLARAGEARAPLFGPAQFARSTAAALTAVAGR